MAKILEVKKKEDVPAEFRETPICDLLLYHNCKAPHKKYDHAVILIGKCMDNRKQLNMPENFAYVIRTGGGNLRYNEFQISYAIAVGGVECIALLAHTNCGMVNIAERKEKFVKGLCERAGWDKKAAEEHFEKEVPKYELNNEIDFVVSEAERLSKRYPKVKVAPLLYKLEDHKLYWIA